MNVIVSFPEMYNCIISEHIHAALKLSSISLRCISIKLMGLFFVEINMCLSMCTYIIFLHEDGWLQNVKKQTGITF